MDALEKVVRHLLAEHGAAATLAGMSLVELVIAFGRYDLLAWLLEQGLGDVQDRWGRTGLFRVAEGEAVRLLVERGASIHHVDRAGNTPLHAAVKAGRLDVARELLARGADPRAVNRRGLTPLHIAAQHGQTQALAQLLEQRVDLDARDRRGRTPLLAAVVGSHVDCAQALARAGADPRARDRAGRGWRDLAPRVLAHSMKRAVLGTAVPQEWAPDAQGGVRLAERMAAQRAWRPRNWSAGVGLSL